ncbi:MAG: hypothetical protein ACFB14_26365 [Leptolyngbyaceae cyanobacterium]
MTEELQAALTIAQGFNPESLTVDDDGFLAVFSSNAVAQAYIGSIVRFTTLRKLRNGATVAVTEL